VVLAWCPGHSGIPGFERADAAARSASRGPRSSQGYVAQDLCKAAQRAISLIFKEWWSHLDPSTNKLRTIKASPTAWSTSTQLYRRHEVVLARLRNARTPYGRGAPSPLLWTAPCRRTHPRRLPGQSRTYNPTSPKPRPTPSPQRRQTSSTPGISIPRRRPTDERYINRLLLPSLTSPVHLCPGETSVPLLAYSLLSPFPNVPFL
jgi:hypothetical protein